VVAEALRATTRSCGSCWFEVGRLRSTARHRPQHRAKPLHALFSPQCVDGIQHRRAVPRNERGAQCGGRDQSSCLGSRCSVTLRSLSRLRRVAVAAKHRPESARPIYRPIRQRVRGRLPRHRHAGGRGIERLLPCAPCRGRHELEHRTERGCHVHTSASHLRRAGAGACGLILDRRHRGTGATTSAPRVRASSRI